MKVCTRCSKEWVPTLSQHQRRICLDCRTDAPVAHSLTRPQKRPRKEQTDKVFYEKSLPYYRKTFNTGNKHCKDRTIRIVNAYYQDGETAAWATYQEGSDFAHNYPEYAYYQDFRYIVAVVNELGHGGALEAIQNWTLRSDKAG